MDYHRILAHLQSSDHEVLDYELNGLNCIKVNAIVADQPIELIHFFQNELTGLPHFFLVNAEKYGELAHVEWCGIEKLWYVCVNDNEAISVNFEQPELAFEESLNRTINMLEQLLCDPEFNRQELLREFKVNWAAIDSPIKQSMVCASRSGAPELLDIYHPLENKKYGIKNHYIGLGKSVKELNQNHILGRNAKQTKAGGRGIVIPLFDKLNIAPRTKVDLHEWYINAISSLSKWTTSRIAVLLKNEKYYDFWVVFNGKAPSGTTWFGLKLHSDRKRPLPTILEELKHWQLEKFDVEVLNRELLLPRSGANPILAHKKVLLAGCGSVGSELAMKLGAAGIGRLDLCDPDLLTLSNTYRHALSKDFIGHYKVFALADKLMRHFPWLQANAFPGNLTILQAFDKEIWHNSFIERIDNALLDAIFENLLLSNKFDDYDIIIVAIGSPTLERKFNQYLKQSQCKTPVINTWLEGYGIGGHAILDIPNKSGCFDCAYVEEHSGQPGLASNLNFLEQNQSIVKNHAGCGESYIPYGAVSSTQTALIAAELAIKYLENKLTTSSKISYKGDADDALAEGLKLATRYELFDQSLVKTQLYHPQCRQCRGEPAVTYQGCGITIHITQEVFEQFHHYKQTDKTTDESAGLLIASPTADDKSYWLNGITTPKPTDKRTPVSFKLDDRQHKLEVEQIFKQTNGQRDYFGTWHTHPQNDPSPSKIDKKDWQQHAKDNPDRPLVFIIVGIKQIKLYSYASGKLSKLKPCKG